MVLDVKALTWASQHGIDTAKLKAARMPVYGKWYFPDLPANVPLISLETGERRTFPEPMLAGEIVWVRVADLRRAGLLDGEEGPEEPPAAYSAAGLAEAEAEGAEPLLVMSRPPAGPEPAAATHEPSPSEGAAAAAAIEEHEADLSTIHMPRPSIAPFVLAVGLSVALLGVFTHLAILLVGIAWTAVGAIAWIRSGAAPHGGHE